MPRSESSTKRLAEIGELGRKWASRKVPSETVADVFAVFKDEGWTVEEERKLLEWYIEIEPAVSDFFHFLLNHLWYEATKKEPSDDTL